MIIIGILAYDKYKRLPIHYFLSKNGRNINKSNPVYVKILLKLISASKESINLSDIDGNTPYDLAIRECLPLNMLYEFLKINPTLDKQLHDKLQNIDDLDDVEVEYVYINDQDKKNKKVNDNTHDIITEKRSDGRRISSHDSQSLETYGNDEYSDSKASNVDDEYSYSYASDYKTNVGRDYKYSREIYDRIDEQEFDSQSDSKISRETHGSSDDDDYDSSIDAKSSLEMTLSMEYDSSETRTSNYTYGYQSSYGSSYQNYSIDSSYEYSNGSSMGSSYDSSYATAHESDVISVERSLESSQSTYNTEYKSLNSSETTRDINDIDYSNSIENINESLMNESLMSDSLMSGSMNSSSYLDSK